MQYIYVRLKSQGYNRAKSGYAPMPTQVILDVGDILHCYKKAVKSQKGTLENALNLWNGLETVLSHFCQRQVAGVIPSRHFRNVPSGLQTAMEVVVAPHGFSLELLKSVAAGDITDVLSNRDLDLNITSQIHQIRFSFSSRGRFFILPARSAHRSGRRRRSEASVTSLPMSPAEFYIGSDAETEKNAAPERTTSAASWSGRSWTRNSDGAWQAGFTCQQSQKPPGSNAFAAEFAVPFLGRSEALLGYLEELASKLRHVGVAVQLVTPVWQEEHWSLSSLKLCGNRESLQGLAEGSLPISLWCQKSSKFQVQFFCKATSWDAQNLDSKETMPESI